MVFIKCLAKATLILLLSSFVCFYSIKAENDELTNYSEPISTEINNVEDENNKDLTLIDLKSEDIIIEDDKEITSSDSITLLMPEIKRSPYDINNIIEIPYDALKIIGGTLYGISDSWYQNNFPDNPKIKLSLTIPSNINIIATNAFKDNGSSNYEIISLNFADATSLTKIDSQAFMRCTSLSGTLDFSNTKLEILGKSAFNGCKNINGLIFPNSLKHIGDSNNGSVFKDCINLSFIKTNSSNGLPNNLESIGYQSFYNCIALNDQLIVPSSVNYIGNEAFYKSNIGHIYINADNLSNYGGEAFKANNYGLTKRLTIFKNKASRDSYIAAGNNSYKSSLVYEFTLNYGSIKTEKKLSGQMLAVSKGNNGWYFDENYTIPSGEWIYNTKPITSNTILYPTSDSLTLEASFTIVEPTISFIVDDKVIDISDTYPHLNLSNNKEHKIGVKVEHPLLNNTDAPYKVKFEYQWTDVWGIGNQGPRMNEDGFGRYNLFDKPLVANTITINGATHERTTTTNYSKEDYGDGYYLLEIYGYYAPTSGGEWKLFYKSKSTAIGDDPYHTTNTAYLFDVVTSDGVISPSVSFSGNNVIYGYRNAAIIADVEEIDGQNNSYQWYKANINNPNSNGIKINGATSPILPIEDGKDASDYYYYLEVTSTKSLNNDVIITNHPLIFNVKKVLTEINVKNMSKKYDGKPLSLIPTSNLDSIDKFLYRYKYQDGAWSNWQNIAPSIKDAGKIFVETKVDHPNYDSEVASCTLEITKRNITFTSASSSKTYDVMPLKNHKVYISQDGFIENEGVSFFVEGTITNVGTVLNKFSYEANHGTKLSNYNIFVVYGTLTINKAIIPESDDVGDDTNIYPPQNKDNQVTDSIDITDTKTNEKIITTTKPDNTKEDEKDNAMQELNTGHWALMNLIAVIISIILTIITLLIKNKNDSKKLEKQLKLQALAIIDTILIIIAFVFTEDISLKMVLIDEWSIVMALLVVINILLVYKCYKHNQIDA